MATGKENQTLTISLIISVMIAFVLAVTTYLFFQQKGKERQTAASARTDMEKANRDRDAALDTVRRIREVLGTDKDSADAIEAERNELLDKRFPNFTDEPRSLLHLLTWLDDALKKKEEQLAKLEAETRQKVKEQADKAAKAESDRAQAEEARDAAIAEQRKQKADFDGRLAQHAADQDALRRMQDEALAQAKQLRAVTEELTKLSDLLPPDARRRFSAAPPAGQPEPWPERVRFAYEELAARARALENSNATLARLQVADRELQEFVRDATPEEVGRALQTVRQRMRREPKDSVRDWRPTDDRIDGFDGRIVSVNSVDRTVLVTCDSTAGMRPGLVLSVYDPEDPRPQGGTRKAIVEVVEVEGPTLARARIRRESSTSPILANDGVATNLWAPGVAQEVVIVGSEPRRRAGAGDETDEDAGTGDPLLDLLERNGARIVDTVTPQTALVVDTGEPGAENLRDEQDRRRWNLAKSRRNGTIDQAKTFGIRVVTLDGLLDALGLDRDALDGRRLPNQVGAAP